MFLVADENGPIELFPLRLGGPLRFRELTAREMYVWQQKEQYVCGGHPWTAEMEREAGAFYDTEVAPGIVSAEQQAA